jgi:hypothetical protein
MCWGYNDIGRLGDGTTVDKTVPVAVSGLSQVRSISAARFHSCAVFEDCTAKCWGLNTNGWLGDGTTTGSTSPVAVSGLSNVISISAGATHTCAVLENGGGRCWGDNSYGQLGDGTTTSSKTPVAVSGLSTVSRVAAGYIRTCAVLGDGSVQCWGSNWGGQLGDGTTTSSPLPKVACTATRKCFNLMWQALKCCAVNCHHGLLCDAVCVELCLSTLSWRLSDCCVMLQCHCSVAAYSHNSQYHQQLVEQAAELSLAGQPDYPICASLTYGIP